MPESRVRRLLYRSVVGKKNWNVVWDRGGIFSCGTYMVLVCPPPNAVVICLVHANCFVEVTSCTLASGGSSFGCPGGTPHFLPTPIRSHSQRGMPG